jgi:hypothetical protein
MYVRMHLFGEESDRVKYQTLLVRDGRCLCMYVCMFACIYVCMRTCVCVCVYVCTCIYVCMYSRRK